MNELVSTLFIMDSPWVNYLIAQTLTTEEPGRREQGAPWKVELNVRTPERSGLPPWRDLGVKLGFKSSPLAGLVARKETCVGATGALTLSLRDPCS